MVKAATAERFERSQRATVAVDVGKRIRQARQERGMSLAQLGSDDLTRSFLSLVELGRSRISLRALAIVAERLELPMSYFLDDGTAENEALIEIQLDRAESVLRRRDAGQALRLLEGIEIPRRLQARAFWLRGAALRGMERNREAISALHDALALAEKQEDIYLAASVRYELGAALFALGNNDEAMEHLRRALDGLHGDLEDPMLVGRITAYIGHILFARNESMAAIQQYNRAHKLFEAVGGLESQGGMYERLSQSYAAKGDAGTALRFSRLGVGAVEAQQNGYLAAHELNAMAAHFQEIDRVDEATEFAREALERAQRVGSRDVEAASHATLASIYLRQERFGEAAEEAGAADRLAPGEEHGAKVDAWLVLAAVAEREGDRTRADELYTRAIEALRHNDGEHKLGEVALTYSLALRERGDTERALEFALQAAQVRSIPV